MRPSTTCPLCSYVRGRKPHALDCPRRPGAPPRDYWASLTPEERSALNKGKSPRRRGAVLVLLTPEEREEIRAAAERDERPMTAWARRTLLAAARTS